jgi:hypothetical protein
MGTAWNRIARWVVAGTVWVTHDPVGGVKATVLLSALGGAAVKVDSVRVATKYLSNRGDVTAQRQKSKNKNVEVLQHDVP